MMCNKQLEVHDEKEKPLHRIAEKLLSCTKRPMDEQYYKEAFLSNTISYWIDLYYRATEQTSNSIPKEKLYEAMKPYADILLHSMKATINTGYNLKISGNLKLIENRLAEIKNPKLAIDMSASVYEDAKDDSSEEVETEAPKTPTELEAIQNWGKDMPLAGSTESDDTVVGGEIA